MKTSRTVWPLVVGILFFAACASVEEKPELPSDNSRTNWTLDPAKDSNQRVTLMSGLNFDQVKELLGAPKQIKEFHSAAAPTTAWTYFRIIHLGQSLKSGSMQGRTLTALQPITYEETVRLTFVSGALANVTTRRVRDTIVLSDPFGRPQ